MEGLVASWYARLTRRDLSHFRQCARMIAGRLAPGAQVLEIAPGPGYLAIELARLGAFCIEAVDISRSFVRIARRNAARAGVTIGIRQGDVHELPYEPAQFDFIVCRAAFKNFARPIDALEEIRRVLRPAGQALIIDLRRDVSDQEIDRFVADYAASWLNRLVMRRTFKHMLRPRAYTTEEFRRMVATAGFSRCDIRQDAVGLEVWLGH